MSTCTSGGGGATSKVKKQDAKPQLPGAIWTASYLLQPLGGDGVVPALHVVSGELVFAEEPHSLALLAASDRLDHLVEVGLVAFILRDPNGKVRISKPQFRKSQPRVFKSNVQMLYEGERVRIRPLPPSLYTGYLFSGEQSDGRHTVGVLVALSYSNLFEEIHLLLAGEENDFGVAKDHDGVRQLVAKQPRLRGETEETSQSLCSFHKIMSA